jgi:hypothetical protein
MNDNLKPETIPETEMLSRDERLTVYYSHSSDPACVALAASIDLRGETSLYRAAGYYGQLHTALAASTPRKPVSGYDARHSRPAD